MGSRFATLVFFDYVQGEVRWDVEMRHGPIWRAIQGGQNSNSTSGTCQEDTGIMFFFVPDWQIDSLNEF